MGIMRKIGKEGDLKISWNENNEQEIETARKVFDEKIKEGWAAFKEKVLGTKGDKIKIFDKYAERIILVPPISGGGLFGFYFGRYTGLLQHEYLTKKSKEEEREDKRRKKE